LFHNIKETGGMSMKQKSKSSFFSLIAFIVVIFGIISVIVVFNYNKRTIWNTGNISGNTAGNLYNYGLFCEYNDKVYFSNAYDQGDLYVMDSNGTHIKKFYNDTASYINVYGKYLYYGRNNLNEDTRSAIFRGNLFGAYRINTDGSNLLCFSQEPCGVVSLGNNKVFYQHYESETALSLRSVSINGKNEKTIHTSAINPSCIEDGSMYFNNVSDNYNLSALDIDSGNTRVIHEGSFWYPIFDDPYIYYMDIANDYSLARINLSNNEKEDLGTGRVDTYNLYGDYIYFQTNDTKSPSLNRMRKDGTNVEKIIDGNFCNINITSNFVYFNQFGYDTPIYKVSTTGGINVTRFDEADIAVVEEK
jgi:hypothetical protein